jgi:hypothetical protein
MLTTQVSGILMSIGYNLEGKNYLLKRIIIINLSK